MVEAMPGKWWSVQSHGDDGSYIYLDCFPCEAWLTATGSERVALSAGIVALRNHFAALMERYERMRAALQFLIDGCPCMPVFNEECRCRKAARALADADKPLESRT